MSLRHVTQCRLIGVPVQDGAGRPGCEMGPSAFRAAGIAKSLADLGYEVADLGNVAPVPLRPMTHGNGALKLLPEVAGWTAALARHAYEASAGRDAMPIFLGGDHCLAAGTLTGLALRAAEMRRPLFVLWLDAHPDFHTLETSETGNLHGVPMAYATGRPGFDGFFPRPPACLDPANVCMLGIRSVDPAERRALEHSGITVHDMRRIDEHGIAPLLRPFLQRVAEADGLLHVSLDVDFLDPGIAPGVGTTVPGGATFREAHLVMEMLHESGLVSSVELVELNPFLDERGRTAILMVDLLASLMGRRVLDYPTRSFRS
ncbi:arginase [Arenibaculum pallidiluteum]|uniref:arginase n=1 Tax=Arenibaculum pallidiluteum TaxID=2812559 RepID=UPI001A96BD3C|nr:arginase [Arenibaculum pallidiluteum]